MKIRLQGAKFIFTSFSLWPIYSKKQTGVFFLPLLLSNLLFHISNFFFSLHFNSLSALGHSYDSSVCHIEDARQTDSQRVCLYLRRVNHNLVLGASSKNRPICAACTLLHRQLAVCTITDTFLYNWSIWSQLAVGGEPIVRQRNILIIFYELCRNVYRVRFSLWCKHNFHNTSHADKNKYLADRMLMIFCRFLAGAALKNILKLDWIKICKEIKACLYPPSCLSWCIWPNVIRTLVVLFRTASCKFSCHCICSLIVCTDAGNSLHC